MKSLQFLKHMKRGYLVSGVLVLLIASLLLIPRNNQRPKVEFTTIKKQTINSTVSASGNLAGKQTASLHFRSSGKLAFLNISPGDVVTTGQTIAGLDTQDLNITLQQALNTFRDKQATAQKIEDDVKDHTSDETFTQKQTRTTAQAARDSAYDSVKAAQRAFQDAVITAPFSGLITKADFTPGQVVTTTDMVAELIDDSTYFADTDIDEADIGKISIGQKANFTLDAYPDQEIQGVVKEIRPTTKTTSSGATVVIVRVNIGKPVIHFVSGLSGQVSIITAESQNTLTIPQEALGEDHTVLVKTEKGIRVEKVVTGVASDTDVEIKQGLKEGDQVALNPTEISKRSNQRGAGTIFRFFRGGS
ncbi:efflux RND transporter periplasmic adaptor subunit [Candidatus Daviesbacteria bacterium]|nr:efflux RND transporter periplasmic adaptor subunit [Candidatus Daviesbacteria bacterium]